MNWFAKLPNSREAAPGVEMDVLRALPRAFFAGTLLLAMPVIFLRVILWPDIEEAKLITTVDYFTVGTVLAYWTSLITVAFGAVIVWVMKGPAYVADAYPLSDAEEPPVAD
jgi:hypothetical protein